MNSLPLVVRLSSTSISHVPAIGFGTWNVTEPPGQENGTLTHTDPNTGAVITARG